MGKQLGLLSARGPRRSWRPLLAVALVAATALAIGADGSLATGALMMLPALVLAAIMLTRPYLGERVIARLRMRRGARRRAPATCAHTGLSFAPFAASGGRLIAAALAGRAPPACLADCG
jgi:hypothetical protein